MARRLGGLPAALVLLAACNSIVGFDDLQKVEDDDAGEKPGGGTGSGGGKDANAPDVDLPPSTRCDAAQPFGAPAIVPELDGADETKSALMTPDELEIFYLRGDSAPYELRHAVRDTTDSPWSTPVSQPFSADAVQLTSIAVGGLKLYYWSAPLGGSSIKTEGVSRSSLKTDWSADSFALDGNGSEEPDLIVANDDAAYWAKYIMLDGATEQTIFRGNLVGTGILAGAIAGGLHVASAQDSNPVVIKNETVIYFASKRPGSIGDSEDVWRAQRANSGVDFGAPVRVAELANTSFDEPTWVSDDECVILMNRSTHFYVAKRPQ